MEHIFDDLQVSDITDQATNFFSALSPVVVLVVGILLAFFIITFLVRSMKQATNGDGGYDYPDNGDDHFDDDFDDGFDDDE